MASKITTPEGFREAVEQLGLVLDTLSADQAAGYADAIKGAAGKAARRCATDDLDDLRLKVDALKRRLGRKWKALRRNNAISVVLGGGCAAGVGILLKYPEAIPPWATIVLGVFGLVFGGLAATSLMSSTDWREDVARPIGDAADALTKVLAERDEDDDAPYRSPGSTRTRVTPTIAGEPVETLHPETPAKAERK